MLLPLIVNPANVGESVPAKPYTVPVALILPAALNVKSKFSSPCVVVVVSLTLTATVPLASGNTISLSAVTVVACNFTSQSSGVVPSNISLVP